MTRPLWRRLIAILIAGALLTAIPQTVLAGRCNPGHGDNNVVMQAWRGQDTWGTNKKYILINGEIDVPFRPYVEHSGEALYFFIEARDKDWTSGQNNGTIRAGLKFTETATYRYFYFIDNYGTLHLNEAISEVSIDTLEYNNLVQISRLNLEHGTLWKMSVGGFTQEVWQPGGLWAPALKEYRWEWRSRNTNNQWFGSYGDAFRLFNARLTTDQDPDGESNPANLSGTQDFISSVVKWDHVNENTFKTWDTSCS